MANESLETKVSSDESISIEFGTFLWKKIVFIDASAQDILLTVAINPRMNDGISYFIHPSKYFICNQVPVEEYQKTIEQYKVLDNVKASIVNFIDMSALFLGVVLGILVLIKTESLRDYNYLIMGITSLSIILSVLFRRLSVGVLSQEKMLLRNFIFCTISLVWYVQFYDIPGLVILGISLFGFGAMWKLRGNMTFIK